MHAATWSCMKPPCKLQILQESHGDLLNKVYRCMELHGAVWSCMEPPYKLQISDVLILEYRYWWYRLVVSVSVNKANTCRYFLSTK